MCGVCFHLWWLLLFMMIFTFKFQHFLVVSLISVIGQAIVLRIVFFLFMERGGINTDVWIGNSSSFIDSLLIEVSTLFDKKAFYDGFP
jgi:hypothetical protein